VQYCLSTAGHSAEAWNVTGSLQIVTQQIWSVFQVLSHASILDDFQGRGIPTAANQPPRPALKPEEPSDSWAPDNSEAMAHSNCLGRAQRAVIAEGGGLPTQTFHPPGTVDCARDVKSCYRERHWRDDAGLEASDQTSGDTTDPPLATGPWPCSARRLDQTQARVPTTLSGVW